MKTSPSHFNQELDQEDRKILATLETQPYDAYSYSELLSLLYPVTCTDNESLQIQLALTEAMTLTEGLHKLVQKGFVKSMNINGHAYYISTKAKLNGLMETDTAHEPLAV
jgi:hypothetical protein